MAYNSFVEYEQRITQEINNSVDDLQSVDLRRSIFLDPPLAIPAPVVDKPFNNAYEQDDFGDSIDFITSAKDGNREKTQSQERQMFEKMEWINRVKNVERLLDVKNMHKGTSQEKGVGPDKDKKIIERVIENWD